MKTKGDSYVLGGIMAVALFVVIWSLMMARWESKLLPLILGGIIFVLAAAELRSNILLGHAPAATAETGAGSTETLGGYLITWAWVVGFLVGIFLVGFLIAVPLFILLYMKVHGSRWIWTIITAAVTTILIYCAFELLLNITLYRGLFFGSMGW